MSCIKDDAEPGRSSGRQSRRSSASPLAVKGPSLELTTSEFMARTLTDAEIEVIVLKAVWELIDSAVNYVVLSIGGEDPHSEIRFHTPIHQRFFNIVLVDLLS